MGEKNIGKNFFGNNYFLAAGLDFDVAENIQLVGSYTYLFGPGHNSFNKNLEYKRCNTACSIPPTYWWTGDQSSTKELFIGFLCKGSINLR